jgi:hypothetical protein
MDFSTENNPVQDELADYAFPDNQEIVLVTSKLVAVIYMVNYSMATCNQEEEIYMVTCMVICRVAI